MSKGFDISVRNVPVDVRKIILAVQTKEKEKRGRMQYSMSSTIFKIIREWNNKCREVSE